MTENTEMVAQRKHALRCAQSDQGNSGWKVSEDQFAMRLTQTRSAAGWPSVAAPAAVSITTV